MAATLPVGHDRQRPMSPRTAPAYMIERIARGHGGNIQLAHTPESLVIGAMLQRLITQNFDRSPATAQPDLNHIRRTPSSLRLRTVDMDDLIQEFIAETRETLDALASELVLWEQNPHDSERLASIFRFVHTVKGSCGFLNLPRFERLSHAAEDVLAQVRDGKREASAPLVDAVLAMIDRIGELIVVMETGEALPDGTDADLIAALTPQDASRMPLAPTATPVSRRCRRACASAGRDPIDPRAARPDRSPDERRVGHGAGAQRGRPVPARRPERPGAGKRLRPAFRLHRRHARCHRPDADAADRAHLLAPAPAGARSVCRPWQAGRSAHLGQRCRARPRDDRDDPRSADPHHPQLHRPWHRIARRAQPGRASPSRPPVSISARQSGNQILIEIADDGRGIDIDKLVARALAAKVRSASEIHALSERARLELIFAPGLSTADQVTAISGRGVGMDVVRSNIERIGGSIDLENQSRQGPARHPARAADADDHPVPDGARRRPGICDAALGDPRDPVRQQRSRSASSRSAVADLAYIRGECLPYVALETMLGLDDGSRTPPRSHRTIITVNASSDLRYALAVEAVIDHEELVVRPGAPVIMADGLYAGTTLPDNGRPMLLLDPLGLANRARLNELVRRTEPMAATGRRAAVAEGGSALLFREIDRRPCG